jgi:hypothetical protein
MKKNLVLNVLAAICLSIVIVSALPMNSIQQYEAYDPWMDIDDNGIINMIDLYEVALRFGSTGTAINKTDLLLQLLSRLDELNATVIEQQTIINNLNQAVAYLNETVTILNGTGLGAPDYDSGWRDLPLIGGLHLTHNLNTTDVVVYLIGKYYSNDIAVVHQWDYGGSSSTGDVEGHGAFWTELCNTTIAIYRGRTDTSNHIRWEYARVMIWKVPQP